jgi:VWFA-related protein
MTRRSAVQLLASASAWAQKPRELPPAVPHQTVVIDAVVADAQGNAVRNLGPSDFTVALGSEQPAISAFAAVDALTGATRAAAPMPLPMKIDPGDVQRTFVFVVDDAGIPAAHITGLRDALLHFVNEQMGERDVFALIRTSSGSGPVEQVFKERAPMLAAIQRIAVNPAAGLPSAPPWPQTLHYALQGIHAVPGRKAVVLAWERMPAYPNFDAVIALANRAWSSIYAIRGGDSPSPQIGAMAELTASTGGLNLAADFPAALQRVLQDQESYYLLGVESDPLFTWRDLPVSVKCKRSGMAVRTRSQPPATEPLTRPADSGSPQVELRRVVVSPMESGSMHVGISPLFSHAAASWIDVALLLDAHELTFTHKANGIHAGALDFLVRVYDSAGEIADDHGSTVTLPLTTAAYEELLKRGLCFACRANLSKPGVFQIYAAVRDSTSGNTGTAHRLIEAPDIAGGELALSSITLLPQYAPAESAEQEHPLDWARRTFGANEPFSYSCSVYNAAADEQKCAQIEVTLTIYAGGRLVHQADPIPLTVADAANKQWLAVHGKLQLHTNTGPGEFILQLTVRDKVKPRTASQWTDFRWGVV